MSVKKILCLTEILCLALVFAIMSLTSTYAQPAPAPIVLRTASWMPEDHETSRVTRWWADRVTEKTGGRVQFKHFYGEALGKGTEQVGSLKSGLFDIGPFLPFWSPSKTPLWTVYAGPKASSNDPYVRIMVFWDLASMPVMQKELAQWNTMFLFPYALGDIKHIWTVKKPIYKLDDVKGLRIKDIGLSAKALELIGANAVAVTAPETYDALMKGVIDGQNNADASTMAYKLHEVCRYRSTIMTGMGGPVWLINISVFNNLSPDIQKIMMDVSHGELTSYFVKRDAEFGKAAEDIFKKANVTIIPFPKEEQKKFDDIAVEPTMEGWIKSMESKGLPAREVYKVFRDSALKWEKR